MSSPRLATRALLLHQDRLLLVNAYPGDVSDLWCAPGGGVEKGSSLPDNLRRELHEETGLDVAVGDIALVNEFHDPTRGFHQVELFFRCTLAAGVLSDAWKDPEGVVTKRRFFTRAELAGIRFKPDCLADVVWGGANSADARDETRSAGARYDPLETVVR